jgi:hypothetical protein
MALEVIQMGTRLRAVIASGLALGTVALLATGCSNKPSASQLASFCGDVAAAGFSQSLAQTVGGRSPSDAGLARKAARMGQPYADDRNDVYALGADCDTAGYGTDPSSSSLPSDGSSSLPSDGSSSLPSDGSSSLPSDGSSSLPSDGSSTLGSS